jgi:thioredoxin:protein disulfide reductase
MIRAFFAWLLLALSASAADSIEESLLPAEQAFAFESTLKDPHTVSARWRVAEGYYLYRDRFGFFIDTPGYRLGEPIVPDGTIKKDEFFGETEIYRGSVEILLPVSYEDGAAPRFSLRARAQGCADLGVCYPPYTQTVELTMPASVVGSAPEATSFAGFASAAPDGIAGLMRNAVIGDADVLDPEKAFRVEAHAPKDDLVRLRLLIEPGHYLYKDKLAFSVTSPAQAVAGKPELPVGTFQEDRFFGRQEIYDHDVEVLLPIKNLPQGVTAITLTVKLQGCAKTGICYPPATREVMAALTSAAPGDNEPASVTAPEQDRIAEQLATGNIGWSIMVFFGLGLLLAFTPCVLPMVPILSGLIVGQRHHLTPRTAFMLSAVFVLAMALTYAALGVVAGASGANLQAWFQKPGVLITFAGVFVLLDLSMFGLYDLHLPAVWRNRLSAASNHQKSGSLFGAGVMGFFSAIIVGPCVTPPLVGALLYMGHGGSALEGGLALFSMGLGMGTPLLILGASAGTLLPKAGAWMDAVKELFGVLLLGVALWLLERVIPPALLMALAGVLLIISGIYMGALDSVASADTSWRRLWKAFGLAGMIYGALLLVGAAGGGQNLLQPLKGVLVLSGTREVHDGLAFTPIKGANGLKAALADAGNRGKTVMLDFYADWCVACKEMEAQTFSDAAVKASLADAVLLQADVTPWDARDQELLRSLDIYGPPAILFFDERGNELKSRRIFGFMKAQDFAGHVRDSWSHAATAEADR